MVDKAVYREHFSGFCGPLAKLLHERRGWELYRVTTSFENSPRCGADHLFASPDRGGILDALGWSPDFDDGLVVRCKAQCLIDNPEAEVITLAQLEKFAIKAIAEVQSSASRAEKLAAVADELLSRYDADGSSGFETFDPFSGIPGQQSPAYS
jgi:hypothetical protein